MQLNTTTAHSSCEVTNILDHSHHLARAQNIIVLPTQSRIDECNRVNAVVFNPSEHEISISPESLTAKVHFDVDDGCSVFTADNLIKDPAAISSLLSESTYQPFPIANLPSHKLHRYARILTAQAVLSDEFEKEEEESSSAPATADAGYIPSQMEREERLKTLYNIESDIADFGRDYGQDLGLEKPLPEFQPIERFDIYSVQPAYRSYVSYLLNKYDAAMSRHSYDIGDTSKTLGYLTIILVKELPKCNNKVYSLQGYKREILKSILVMMLKHKTIERSSTDKLPCPCFIIGKKDPNSSPRFLIDSTQINPYLATTHQILPKIQPLLQETVYWGL